MTWGEIKLITLQRMFAVNGDEIIQDDTTLPYIKAMPGAANEALQLLSTAGKYIVKSMEITQGGQLDKGENGGKSPPEPLPMEDGSPEAVITVGSVVKYNLDELVSDFYSLKENQIYFDDGQTYGKTADFKMESNNILVLPANKTGSWTVYYNAYPKNVSGATADEEDLALDPEVGVLVPLYMASQLYKDDDIGQSVQFRNEFEVGRELLMQNAMKAAAGQDSFISVTGWI